MINIRVDKDYHKALKGPTFDIHVLVHYRSVEHVRSIFNTAYVHVLFVNTVKNRDRLNNKYNRIVILLELVPLIYPSNSDFGMVSPKSFMLIGLSQLIVSCSADMS